MIEFPGYKPEAVEVPVIPSRNDFEKSAYQDIRKFARLARTDSLVSGMTFGGSNLRLNYLLLGAMVGGLLMIVAWWALTE